MPVPWRHFWNWPAGLEPVGKDFNRRRPGWHWGSVAGGPAQRPQLFLGPRLSGFDDHGLFVLSQSALPSADGSARDVELSVLGEGDGGGLRGGRTVAGELSHAKRKLYPSR